MLKSIRWALPLVAAIFSALAFETSRAADDPLPSWNDCPARRSMIDFVEKTTKKGSPDFIPPELRIATFDNDGTLWCEQPMYFQELFAFDRIKEIAKQHPEWKDKDPYKLVLEGNLKALADQGEKSLLEIIASTHAGMTVEDFHQIVRDWMHTASHPRFHRPYDQCIYQPMVEVLKYLRANGFHTFIVSGGGVEFMRPWVERAYGIPPQQVVGSSGIVKYEWNDGKPLLLKQPKVEFIDDGPGKPVGINRFIGRHPVFAFGNSDGDLEMLQWTTKGPESYSLKTREPRHRQARLGLIVHHTDAEREYAYDRHSAVGRLDKALDAAPKEGWILVDMKKDWKVIFPPEKR
jgi:phosphoglycolate phosphatase-like HAD superfamily hydrolase